MAGHLLAALRRALAPASRRAGVSRIEVTVDAAAPLPEGRSGVRLTVHDDGAPDDGDAGTTDDDAGTTDDAGAGTTDEDGAGTTDEDGDAGTTVTWQSPLRTTGILRTNVHAPYGWRNDSGSVASRIAPDQA